MARRKRKTGKKRSKASAKAPARLSPLIRSAMEVLEHGLWHFFRSDTVTDMRFAILHVDQAIELFMKERVRAAGRSIHKARNSKETLGIYALYEILENELHCSIPERADLELLHEERNSIQHKYLNPSPEDASFHIEKGVQFVRRFLKDELGEDIYEYVSSNYLDEFLT